MISCLPTHYIIDKTHSVSLQRWILCRNLNETYTITILAYKQGDYSGSVYLRRFRSIITCSEYWNIISNIHRLWLNIIWMCPCLECTKKEYNNKVRSHHRYPELWATIHLLHVVWFRKFGGDTGCVCDGASRRTINLRVLRNIVEAIHSVRLMSTMFVFLVYMETPAKVIS